MSKKVGHVVVILVLLLSGFAGIIAIIPPTVKAYTPHDPIIIAGDADFAAQATSEGWPGDGTEGYPYVIEGYEITLDDRYPWYYNAIDIKCTEEHFIIRDSKIIGQYPDHLIFLNNVRNGKIENCIIENGSLGIYIWAGGKNIITNNTLINNNLLFWETSEDTFIGNRFIERGFEVKGFELERWNTHNIDTSNTVNGKPVYYWKNCNGGVIPSGAGQVILVNCTYVTVENQELTKSSHGIILGYSSNINVKGNTIDSNNEAGIYLWVSSENTIIDNNIFSNKEGINLQNSNNNTIQNNEIKTNGRGVSLFHSSRNSIIGNNASSNNGDGINIYSSSYYSSERFIPYGNTIKNNIVANNRNGIFIDNSNGNNIVDNIADSNRRSGLYVENSDENIFRNNFVSNNSAGFYLSSSNRTEIIGNIALNNYYGFRLEDFSNETSIIGNNISNNYYGIGLRFSYDNIFHHNNIINNTVQLDRNDTINTWDDSYGEGNHWSDYTGLDDGSDGRTAGDGVGDTDLPHQGVDYYPLMEPVDIRDYSEDEEEGFCIFSEPWLLFLIALIVIVIIGFLTFRAFKKLNQDFHHYQDDNNRKYNHN